MELRFLISFPQPQVACDSSRVGTELGRRWKGQERPSLTKADEYDICVFWVGQIPSSDSFFSTPHYGILSLSYPLWTLGKSLSLARCFSLHFHPLLPIVTSSLFLLRPLPFGMKPFGLVVSNNPKPDPTCKSSWLTRRLWHPLPTSTNVQFSLHCMYMSLYGHQAGSSRNRLWPQRKKKKKD